MPALMNSRVGSLAGMIEADPIRAWCRSVKNRRKISRISSLPRGRFMPPSMLPAPAGLASGFWVCSCVRVQGTAGGRAYQNAVPVGVYGPAISHGKPYYEGVNAGAGRKYRLSRTRDRAERLTAWGHTCRAIWNVALEQRRFAWEQQRHTMRSA